MNTTTAEPDELPNPYELPVWEHPAYYAGFSPDGDFVLAGQHRDSDALERCNYEDFFALMREKVVELQLDPPEGEFWDGFRTEWVYDFRASHWGVGWVETLLMRRDAPEPLQKEAYETLAALADYPVLDESHLSEVEFEEAEEAWNFMSLRDKIELCARAGASIFAARHELSEADQVSDLVSYLRE